jgi:uncharacterized protein (TIGR02118 family)
MMAAAKIIVLYPTPRDAAAFEHAYTAEHAPMVTPQTFPGLTKFVATRITATPDGSAAPFARMAELHFSSMASLQTAAATPLAQKAVAHAVSISSGGPPIFLVAEEEVSPFD